MTFQSYFNTLKESGGDIISYEEQLLLNYDDYLKRSFSKSGTLSSHFSLELDELEDDYDSEYDENDWEEDENSSEKPEGEFDHNKEEPGTFQMKELNWTCKSY